MNGHSAFPVTIVDCVIEPTGVGQCRRGAGRSIATATLSLGSTGLRGAKVSTPRKASGAKAAELEAARKTCDLIGSGLRALAGLLPKLPQVRDRLKAMRRRSATLRIELLQENEWLLEGNQAGETGRNRMPLLRADAGVCASLSNGVRVGLPMLYAMGLLHESCRIAGDDERQALKSVIALYEALSSEQRSSLELTLSEPAIDNGNVFLRFLRESKGQDNDEVDRQIARLRARTQVELPYDDTEVRRAIYEETDIASLRLRVYNAIKDTYTPEIDTVNAQRIADHCREIGMRLVGGRFSRAFYLDAMLMASAKVLRGQSLQKSISALAGLPRRLSVDLKTPGLAVSFDSLGGELQLLLNAASRDEISQAEVEGILGKFMTALRELETKALKAVDDAQDKNRERIALEQGAKKASSFLRILNRDRDEIRRKIDRITGAVSDIQAQLALAPKSEPAYMAFFQRLFELDAINLGTVNEFVDPFFGEDEHVQRLIRECGHNMYITPNLEAWLHHCQDWIEALPAYARYEVVPKEGGGYEIHAFVQRQILEIMYRRHAADWAENINHVMDSEHVAIARDLLIEQLRLQRQVQTIMSSSDVSREEAVRQVCRKRDLAQPIANLAALVEQTYVNLCLDVARYREDNDVSRMEAVRAIVQEDRTSANLLRSLLKRAKGLPKRLTSAVSRQKLSKTAARLLAVALKRRREVPCVHVLTTLGPGETEFNVQNWLEESMALYNVCKGFNLEEAVEARIDEYQKRLASVGSRVIEELDLQGELYNVIEEEGLQAENDRPEAVLKLVASYPEVAGGVSDLAVLIEDEEKRGERTADPANADEPKCVTTHLQSHPELEEEATEKVVQSNDLAAEIRRVAEAHAINEAEAIRQVIDENPDYRTEKESLKLAAARAAVIAERGLAEEARAYMNRYLDRRLATVAVRRQIVAEKGLSKELDSPRFRYDAAGPFKKFNLLYTPSRVDLGAKEVDSVKNVSKWVGGRDRDAANAGRRLYSLYNVAGVTAVEETRLAEFMKVGENFFSRGGPFYLSLTAGVNIDVLRTGDFEFFRDQWNLRGDRVVLPAGETYGGFCVPKEFTLLHAIIFSAVRKETSAEILENFGIPKEIHAEIIDDMRKALRMRTETADELEWDQKAGQFLTNRYPEYFSMAKAPACVARLPQLAGTFDRMGLIDPDDEEGRRAEYTFANWVNKKAQGLEEINRSGPFRKVHLIYQLIADARKTNGHIAPNDKLIGTMSAPYKEGEREDGKEIPITDVRFSAGSRKLEIYAGTAADHLLKDIDPEGREAITALLSDFSPPADIRIVGTCTGSDILNHVPKSGLEEIKDRALARLMDEGLDETVIDANCTVYGGDLEEWAGLKELPEAERRKVLDDLTGIIHLLVTDRRGTCRSYEDAVQGIDFLDLGIPDPGLLDLVDDLPKLLYLMRKGRPHSALVLADGTSGGRRRSLSFRYASSKRKVKELLALDDSVQYGALGLGAGIVASWKSEAIQDREQARVLYDAIVAGEADRAEEQLQRITARLCSEARAQEAARDEINARRLNVLTQDYRYVSQAMGRIAGGITIPEMDFGTWLLLGGMYVLNGKLSTEAIERRRDAFDKAVSKLAKKKRSAVFTSKDVDRILASFVRPIYIPPPEEEFRQVESGISGSLKAAEEKVARLEKREARRRQALRARALRRRKNGFVATEGEAQRALQKNGFPALYDNAKAAIGDPCAAIDQHAFGRFLAWSRSALHALIKIVPPRQDADAIAQRFSDYLDGGEIDDDGYAQACDDIARVAEAADSDLELLERVALATELLDIAFAVEKTQDIDDPADMMIEMARFFDTTLNNHVFDYPPYHYHKQRGVGYECLDRQMLFRLCAKTHRWLYTYLRTRLVHDTPLRDREAAYHDAWLGDADRDVLAIGVHVDDPAQRFWFSYVRLRDASVLWHENFPLPEVFTDLDPNAIKSEERANVAIVYPHGNTTVPVALEQGAKLAAKERINLMLTAFPTMEQDERHGRELLHLHDGLMYIGREDYRAALASSNVPSDVIEKRVKSVTDEGVLVLASFARPVIAHGIFFHFTHPMRPEIGRLGIPLIQPIVWEAATHLKCRLPDMLKGSGIRTADQINWFQADSEGRREPEAKAEIRRRLTKFAAVAPTIIVKPEKESGGRRARILPVRREGSLIQENIADLADLVYEISHTDNAAIQSVIQSRVRQLYTREFLEGMVDRFTMIGASVLLDRDPLTPLFSYFRQVLALGKDGYEVSHNITVVSTAGIANVGQGGLLYEYTDEIINDKYRDDLRREIRKAAFNSMESQRKYIKQHWKMILNEYLAIHPEYNGRVAMELGEDINGFNDCDIPYEMGDYMPMFLVDENDNLTQLYDEDKETLLPLFDESGKPTSVKVYDARGKALPRRKANGDPLPIPLFDENGKRRKLFDKKKRPVSTLVCLKIEPNPGAGLWRPHNDQLPPERKGEGVYIIFRCLGERAALCRDKLQAMAGAPQASVSGRASQYYAGVHSPNSEGGPNDDALDRAAARAKDALKKQ